ncbi:transposase [Bradyrhizobium genosp. P]|uniref:transposase n=1 Tax=Bradyrhizobium genosp. P TaxID=83641 RepID=UPI003CF2F879
MNADEAASWDGLHERFEMKRINHQEAYSLDGARTNHAEEYFSRLRRGEIQHPPSHCWRVSTPLRSGIVIAGGQPPRLERRSGESNCRTGFKST